MSDETTTVKRENRLKSWPKLRNKNTSSGNTKTSTVEIRKVSGTRKSQWWREEEKNDESRKYKIVDDKHINLWDFVVHYDDIQ